MLGKRFGGDNYIYSFAKKISYYLSKILLITQLLIDNLDIYILYVNYVLIKTIIIIFLYKLLIDEQFNNIIGKIGMKKVKLS
jgi:hypothetical protein